MLTNSQNLNPKIFDDDIEMIPTRNGYGRGVCQAGEKNKDVVVICADLAESTRSHFFAEKFPERFVEVGVAEQNLATVASGMANYGKIPFISSYAVFSPGRNLEQIRTTVALNNVPVKIVGSHAGVSVGPDGATHQALEDIALMRVMPNMMVVVPCDAIEAEKATIAIAQTKIPTYVRLGREKTPVITKDDTLFKLGKAEVFRDPGKKPDVAIIGCGPALHEALLAAEELSKEKTEAIVLNNHTVKPLDEEMIEAAARNAGAVVTVEEHQIAGGMGSAVAEFLVGCCPVPIEFVGIEDKFGQSGTPEELAKHYGLDKDSIIEKVKKVIKRK